MAQQEGEGESEHDATITQNFGTPEKLYQRFVRGAEGFYNVTPTDVDAEYTVERDGSDHVYTVSVREMRCDCGDKKGLCKHLWRAMMETGDLPEIGVNVAANTTTTDDEDARPPSEIVLTDAQLEQMLVATDILSITSDVADAFEEEAGGEHVGELNAGLKDKVVSTLKMACGNSGFDGPACDAELEAAHGAMDAVERAEAI